MHDALVADTGVDPAVAGTVVAGTVVAGTVVAGTVVAGTVVAGAIVAEGGSESDVADDGSIVDDVVGAAGAVVEA